MELNRSDERIYNAADAACVLTPDCEKIMENAVTKLGFSARGYDRILKRFRTTGCSTCGYGGTERGWKPMNHRR